MAVNLGTAYIRIAPRLDGVSNSIKSALVGGAEGASGGIGSQLAGSVGTVAIGTALGGALLAGVKAVAGKITSTVSDIISGATEQMDSIIRTKVALSQMGYEESVVSKNLAMLRTNANKTAADFGDLADGFLTLTASWKDIDLTARATRALSDAILAMGGTPEMVANAITQIGQVDLDGPLDGETWRSLRNSGLIPVLGTIAEMNNLSLAEYKEELGAKGELTTRNFINGLLELDEQGSKTQKSLESIAVSNAAATWSGSWEAAKENVTSAISQMMEKAWSASGLGQTIIDAADRIGKSLPGIVDTIKSKIMDFLSKTKLDVLLPKLAQFLGGVLNVLWQLISVAIQLRAAIFDRFVAPLLAVLNEKLAPALEWLGGVFNWLAGVLDYVASHAGEFVNGFANGIVIGMTAVSDFITNTWNGIVSFFQGVWERISVVFAPVANVFKSLFQAAANAIKATFSPIVDFFKIIFDAISHAFDGVREVGKNIIKGLWNGIKDMGAWIKEKIQGFGESVLQSLKDFFGIKSPSKVMAEQGKYIAQGLALGIADNARYASDAMDQMSEEMLGSFGGMTGGMVSAMGRMAPMAPGSGVAAQVVQNNVFNQVESELDVKEASKLLGWQVATAI